MSVSIEGSGSITGVSTFYNATFSGITTFADNINFDANIAGVTTFLGVGVTSLNVLGVSTFTGQLNAGTISATTLSATTVSIAGTLTYQDVTNIDSVGIITARSGIHVTDGKVGIGTNIITDNSVFVELVADSSQVPRLQFDNKPVVGTNNGEVGSILFRNNTDSVGYIICKRESAADDGYIQFGTQATGGGVTERLRITSTGVIDASVSNTTAVALPQGTTAQRPTGSAPYIRKNTTNNALEYYDGTSWVEIITDYFPTGSTIFG